MFSIFANSGKISYGQKQYLLDFETDIANLPTDDTPGSIAFVIETSTYYMINHQQAWVKVTLSNGGASAVEEVIYNGGTL